jgi:general secretion pathway protein B
MSFILDALKKSETERQEQGPTEFANIPTSGDSPGVPRWLWVLGLLLAVNLVVLLGLLLRDDTPDVVTPTAKSVPSEPPNPSADSSFAARLDEVREHQPVARANADSMSEPVVATPSEPSPTLDAPRESPPSVKAPRPELTLRALPTADELLANGTIRMAELHLDIHVYSEVPEDRFVFINMTRHRENSQLAEGPVVSEITPEGVILDYRGTEFLLPRE